MHPCVLCIAANLFSRLRLNPAAVLAISKEILGHNDEEWVQPVPLFFITR